MLKLRILFEKYSRVLPPISEDELRRYERYYLLLCEWNQKFNLVSRNSLDNAFSAHFVDSIFICDMAALYRVGPVIDLGSGAGFPGVVFAIRYQQEVALYERTQKKRKFLEELNRQLNLNIQINSDFFRGPSEPATVMARAVLPPLELMKFLRVRVAERSRLILPLAKIEPSLPAGLELLGKRDYELPESGVSRRVAAIELSST